MVSKLKIVVVPLAQALSGADAELWRMTAKSVIEPLGTRRHCENDVDPDKEVNKGKMC